MASFGVVVGKWHEDDVYAFVVEGDARFSVHVPKKAYDAMDVAELDPEDA